MNRRDLRARCSQLSVVDDYLVGHRDFLGERQLGCDTGVCLFVRESITLHQTRLLPGLVGADDYERRESLLGARFYEQRCLIKDIRSRAVLEVSDVLGARRSDEGVEDLIELRAGLLIVEHDVAESFSV